MSFFNTHLLQALENTAKSRKHSPIVWTASDNNQALQSPKKEIPKKEPKPLSAAERLEDELNAFKDLQNLDINPDAPAALKASPSGSESEAGGKRPLLAAVPIDD